jgi:uncharacterized membrane protein (UPF0127 family)
VAWLVREGEVLASVEVARRFRERAVGLLGRTGLEGGALLIEGAKSVHTVGMRFPIDVAFLDRSGRVVATITPLRPFRVTLPRWSARAVLEAPAGAFDRWRLRPGDALEVKG